MEDAAAPARRADPLAWGVFAVLAAVYRWGRCPSFGPGDSPGVVYRALYSPGRDPLAWLGRLVSRLPFDAPQGRVNDLSGLFHAGAAALLFALLRRLGVKRVPALAATALLAFLPRYWYYALVAGRGPAAVFGLALAAYGAVVWRRRPGTASLLFLSVGAALAAVYAPLSISLAPAGLWLAALAAGLLLQRLSLISPAAAAAVLAGLMLLPFARPYDLRRHNPTQEWALAALRSVSETDSVVVSDQGLHDALLVQAAAAGRSSPFGAETGATLYDAVSAESLTAPEFAPDGVLIRRSGRAVGAPELARRAARALDLPALTAVGRRDVAKYGFTRETVLYDQYRDVLLRYRERLGPDQSALRARLDRQLAEYGPGPGAKP
jgi:hypothetical protein